MVKASRQTVQVYFSALSYTTVKRGRKYDRVALLGIENWRVRKVCWKRGFGRTALFRCTLLKNWLGATILSTGIDCACSAPVQRINFAKEAAAHPQNVWSPTWRGGKPACLYKPSHVRQISVVTAFDFYLNTPICRTLTTNEVNVSVVLSCCTAAFGRC